MIAIDIPKLNYSTITVARRVSVEMPFSDARMGAPFKQKNGPALGVAAALGSVSTGVAAISAGSALLGGVMIAGGIASGLGAITGNKTLSTLGAVAGLASFGVGSFTGADGGFLNPFSTAADGSSNFFSTVTGSGVKSVFDSIKGAVGIGNPASGVAGVADDIVNATKPAVGSIAEEIASGGSTLQNFNGVATSTAGKAFDTIKDVGSSIGGILNNQGAMGLIGGLGNGYTEGRKIEAQQPLIDARVQSENANTDATRQQMGLLAQRQQNLQFQPNAAATVNPNAELYNGQPGQGTQGKYAVVVDGTVQYVSQADYDAMRNNQGA